MKNVTKLALLLVAGLLALPLAGAHAHATVVEANGTRCYVVTDGTGTVGGIANARPDRVVPEFWVETNGVLEGGEARGPPAESAGLPVSGLPYWDFGEALFHVLGAEPGDLDEDLEDGTTGLQRGWTFGPDGPIPPDTRVDFDTWVATCLQ